jgi:hypothetical protein
MVKTNQYSLIHAGKKIGRKPMTLELILKDKVKLSSVFIILNYGFITLIERR